MISRKNAAIISSALFFAASAAGCRAPASLQVLKLQQAPPPPQTVTLRMTDYLPAPGRRLKDVFVSNFSVKAEKGQLLQQTNLDLPDDLKRRMAAAYGFSNNGPYSTGLFFSDLFFYLAGVTQAQQNTLYCSETQRISASNDAFIFNNSVGDPVFLGLRDCEKSYLGLAPSKFDHDDDGIPDYLELRCGTNPKNPNDAAISSAADGISNIDKCKRHIPNDETGTSKSNVLFSYKYVNDLQPDGTLTIKVSNIPVVNEGKDNFIAVYLTEASITTGDGTGIGDTTGFPYLYTAYAILPSDSSGKTFNFPFWAKRATVATADPTTFTNQGLQFK